MNSPRLTRRDALETGLRGILAGSGLSLFTTRAAAADAAAAADYRALVCVFLAGGNDSFNMLVPTGSGYAEYQAARGDLAVPEAQLLPITPQNPQGRSFGLHPSLTGLRTLFEAGQAALVANVGTLLQPTTKAQYRANAVPRPAQLFSHSDQTTQWQAQSAAADTAHGWAGRLCDVLLAMNGGSPLSPSVTLAGTTRLLQGQQVVPYALGSNGSVQLSGMTGTRGTRRLQTFRQILQKRHGHTLEEQFAGLQAEAVDLDVLIRTALAAQAPLATVFPSTSFANQLKMVARMIGLRNTFGVQRQVFFVRLGGFDTHSDQNTAQPQLFAALSAALEAFQAAMVELGTAGAVTTFTLSEFGRTLSSNGNGSDHGWGGIQLVLGGAVRGRDLYGTWPSLALDGPDDTGRGRIIPTTSVDQYAATLARWFGLGPTELATVFPRLGRFASSDLGFMT